METFPGKSIDWLAGMLLGLQTFKFIYFGAHEKLFIVKFLVSLNLS